MALGRVRWLCGCRSHPLDVAVGVSQDKPSNQDDNINDDDNNNNNKDEKNDSETHTQSKSASSTSRSDDSAEAAVVGNSDTLKSSTTTINSGGSSGSETASLPPLDLGPTENKHVTPKDFEFLRVIGKGSFGKVLLARHRGEGAYYAVKVLSKKAVLRRNEAGHIMSERHVLLQNVNSPFLVSLHYSFQTQDKLYFVLDYVNGGELFFHLQRERRFPESRARLYAAEASAALGHLHSLGVVYRDLKPENLLLDAQGHLVLTDFGLSKQLSALDGQTHTFCGTPEYLAPEILKNQGYDSAVDWWCLGAVLHEMLFGLPPFYHRDPAEMHDRILRTPLKLKPGVSAEAEDILHKLLRKDRTTRLGAPPHGFQQVKAHAFFRPVDWELLMRRGVQPDFDPSVTDPLDLHNIDPEFTDEPVAHSVAHSASAHAHCVSASAQARDDSAFAGFSYAPPAALL